MLLYVSDNNKASLQNDEEQDGKVSDKKCWKIGNFLNEVSSLNILGAIKAKSIFSRRKSTQIW